VTQQVQKLMIMDACVLIDYVKTESSVLALISRHIGPTYVVSTVLEEVKDLQNQDDLVRLGLIVLEPALEDLFAAAENYGATSFQDNLCLLSAKRHGLICVTNDKNLRKRCKQEGVETYWGLQLIAKLHKAGGLPARSAKNIARSIHEKNPKHITMEIIESFNGIITKQEG